MKQFFFSLTSFLILGNLAQGQTMGSFIQKQPLGNQFVGRSGAGLVATDTHLYIYGGHTGANIQEFAKYNLTSAELEKLDPLGQGPSNPKGKASFKVGNFMYHFDPYGTGVSRYDLINDTWEEYITPLGNFTPESGFVIGTTIYLSSKNNSNTTFWAFDTETLTFTQKADSPASGKRGTFAFAINGMGYMGGGRNAATDNCSNPGCWLGSFYEYNPVNDTWTSKAPFPTGITGAVGVAVNGKGYAGLGTRSPIANGQQETNSALWYEYDPALDNWTAKQNFLGLENQYDYWNTITEASATVLGTDVYIFGGHIRYYGAIYLSNDNISKYNTLTDEWTVVENELGGNRKEAMAVLLNGKLYAGGGQDGEPTSDFHAYDPATDSWEQKADFPAKYTNVATAVIGNKAYFVGGYSYASINSNSIYSALMYEYNPETDTWTLKTNYPGGARRHMIAESYNGELYAGLGMNGSGNFSTNFYKYSPSTETWTPLAAPTLQYPMSSGFHSSSFVIGDHLYIVLHNYSGPNDRMQKYSFADDTWTPVALDFNGLQALEFIDRVFTYGEKGYLVFNQTPDYMSPHKLMEFNPETNTLTYVGNLPFYSSNQNVVETTDGAYFVFGETPPHEMFTAGFQHSNQLWKWTPNPEISTQAGIFDAVNNINSCGISLLTNQYAPITDTDGQLFASLHSPNGQSNICLEVSSINDAYRETIANFGEGETVALFANKSLLSKTGSLNHENYIRLYFTNEELNSFINEFNTTYNETKTINDIKIINHYNNGPLASPDHDPLNNAYGPVASNYTTINTPVVGDYADGKYFQATRNATTTNLLGEIYAVLFTQQPLSTPGFDKNRVIVYPNPTNSLLNIDGTIVKKATLRDLTDKSIMETSHNTMDLQGLQNGIYFVEIIDQNDNRTVLKVIKN